MVDERGAARRSAQSATRNMTTIVHYTLCMIDHRSHLVCAAASIDVNDISLYILCAYASAEDRKHATLVFGTWKQIAILLYSSIFR